MKKIGIIFCFKKINLGIHRLEINEIIMTLNLFLPIKTESLSGQWNCLSYDIKE